MAKGDDVSKILKTYGEHQKRVSEARAHSEPERVKEVARFKEISDKVIAPALGAIKVEIETEGYAAATRLDQDPPAIELRVDLLSKPGALLAGSRHDISHIKFSLGSGPNVALYSSTMSRGSGGSSGSHQRSYRFDEITADAVRTEATGWLAKVVQQRTGYQA